MSLRRFVATVVLLCGAGLAARAAEPFWAQVTFVKGTAIFVPAGGGGPQPLKRGAVLHRGDKVQAAEGGQASFLLSDGSVVVVRSGSEQLLGSAKPGEGPTLTAVAKNLSQALLAREGDNPMLKHLGGLRGGERNLAVGPCQTKVAAADVALVWAARPGVVRYAVTVMGPGDDLYEQTVQGTRLELPAGRLAKGATYYWEVRDAAAADTFTALGSGSFTTLDAKAESRVKSLLEGIGKAFPGPGDDDTPLFLSYQIYRENGMSLDALATVGAMLKRSPEDAELRRWQQDLCKDMGVDERDAPLLLPPAN